MARPKTSDELDNLRKQQAELAEKIKAAEAKQKEREREVQQRRELLAGRAILAAIEAQPDSQVSHEIIEVLSKAIAKKADRELFDFLTTAEGSATAE